MTAPARFSKRDLRRAFEATEGLGFEEVRVIINQNGALEIVVRKNVSELEPEELD